jgi:broad specificity phosphatase PhoE
MANREMKRLYLIRHGESRELAGEEPPAPRNDSPLSLHGQAQAERLAVFIRPQPLDLILTSLFQRAQQTAAGLNEGRGVPVLASMALNEYFLRDNGQGGETTEQGLARSMSFLYQFSPYHEHIAVVSHNAILATLLRSLLNLPFDEARDFGLPGTCRVLRYDWSLGDQNWRQVDQFIP